MSQTQRRAHQRLRVSIRARMRDGLRTGDICILDISQRGLLATTATPPKRGEFIEVMVGTISLVGQVRWSGQHRFGIALQERIDVGAIAKGDLSNFRAKIARRRGVASAPVATIALESGRRAQIVNFCLAIALVLGAGFFFADAVHSQLGALGKASEVMAASRPQKGR